MAWEKDECDVDLLSIRMVWFSFVPFLTVWGLFLWRFGAIHVLDENFNDDEVMY